jgi:hypothetical protein
MSVRFTNKDKRDKYLQSLKQPPAVVPPAPPPEPRRSRAKEAQPKE